MADDDAGKEDAADAQADAAVFNLPQKDAEHGAQRNGKRDDCYL